MIRIILLLFFCFCSALYGSAQQTRADSITKVKVDSSAAAKDSILRKNIEFTRSIINKHPYFSINKEPDYPPYVKKIHPPGKEIYFYVITGLFLLFGLFKVGFAKYFSDLTHLFFRRSLKQRQLKKQVIQNSLPSLLFNIFFVITAGIYIALSVQRSIPAINFPFWQLFLGSAILVGVVYLLKYGVLRFIGWVFKVSKLTDNYIFLIFLVNKILAILLLPLIIIIALTGKPINTIAWTLSWLLITGFVLYRYISAIGLVRKEKTIRFFHFLLYISAFEILPTVMLYKGIVAFLK